MTTIRVKTKKDNYAKIANEPLQDARLSWQARGMLAYLLSLPDNWEIRLEHPIKQSPSGRDSVYSILRELKKYRYLVQEQARDQKGRLIKQCYNLYETPVPLEPKPDVPEPAQPLTDNPDTANPTLQITKVTNNEKTTAIGQGTDSTNHSTACAADTSSFVSQTTMAPPQSTESCATSDSVSAGFIQPSDLPTEQQVIGEKLTELQLAYVKKRLMAFTEQDTNFKLTDYFLGVVYELESKSCFTDAGDDFLKKVNTICKSIRIGKWHMPVNLEQELAEKQKAEKNAYEFKLVELVAERDSLKRMIEFSKEDQSPQLANLREQLDKAEKRIAVFKQSFSQPALHQRGTA